MPTWFSAAQADTRLCVGGLQCAEVLCEVKISGEHVCVFLCLCMVFTLWHNDLALYSKCDYFTAGSKKLKKKKRQGQRNKSENIPKENTFQPHRQC